MLRVKTSEIPFLGWWLYWIRTDFWYAMKFVAYPLITVLSYVAYFAGWDWVIYVAVPLSIIGGYLSVALAYEAGAGDNPKTEFALIALAILCGIGVMILLILK